MAEDSGATSQTYKPVSIKFFACCVIRKSNVPNKFLLIKEPKTFGNVWYFPGGKVDHGETFAEGGIREALEEGGIPVALDGLLRIEHNPDWGELRFLFAASSVDDTPPKQIADSESQEARWITVDALPDFDMRDQDLIPAYQSCARGAPVIPFENFLFERRKKCFSQVRRPGAFLMLVSVVVQTQDAQRVLVNTSSSKFVFTKALKPGEYQLPTGRQILQTLEKESGVELQLTGILCVEHEPLDFIDSVGKLAVTLLASCSQAHESKLSSSTWKWIPVSEISQFNQPDTGCIQQALTARAKHPNPKVVPLRLLAPSIYAPWNF